MHLDGSWVQIFQFFGLLSGTELFNQRVKSTVKHAAKVVQGQSNAMVGDTILWKVVGTNLFAAVSAANLSMSCSILLQLLLLLFLSKQTAAQNFQSFVLVLELAAFVLTFHDHTGGQMGHTDGTGGFVNMLTAGTGCTEGIDPQIFRIDYHIHFICLWHNRYCCGGSMDTPLRFGLGHSLYPVDAAFELDPTVAAIAV